MALVPDTDEGVITDIVDMDCGYRRVYLDNGRSYNTSYTLDQDINDPVFRGVPVRLLLTKAHRIWDISVI